MSYFTKTNCFEKNEKILSTKLISGSFTEDPFVTIAIPTFKRINLIKAAIESAVKQVNFNHFEILVVDNDPTIEQKELENYINSLNDKRIVYYKNKINLGMVGNWNRCIELSSGKWISLLHDDDALNVDYLSIMIPIIKESHNINLLACMSEVVENISDEMLEKRTKNQNVRKYRINNYRLILKNITQAPGILFKKEAALELGGFNDEHYPCSDYSFWIKYIINYQGYIINKQMAIYRFGEESTTKADNLIFELQKVSSKIKRELMVEQKVNGMLGELYFMVSLGGVLNYLYDTKNISKNEVNKFEKESGIIKLYKRQKLNTYLLKILNKLWKIL